MYVVIGLDLGSKLWTYVNVLYIQMLDNLCMTMKLKGWNPSKMIICHVHNKIPLRLLVYDCRQKRVFKKFIYVVIAISVVEIGHHLCFYHYTPSGHWKGLNFLTCILESMKSCSHPHAFEYKENYRLCNILLREDMKRDLMQVFNASFCHGWYLFMKKRMILWEGCLLQLGDEISKKIVFTFNLIC